MRMEGAHHVADDFRAFLERRAGIEAKNMHAVKDAPMHGFEPVAGVGQRAAGDGRQRVAQITLLERFAQRDGRDHANVACALAFSAPAAFLRHLKNPNLA